MKVFQNSADRVLFKNEHIFFLEAKFDFIEVFEIRSVLKVSPPVVGFQAVLPDSFVLLPGRMVGIGPHPLAF